MIVGYRAFLVTHTNSAQLDTSIHRTDSKLPRYLGYLPPPRRLQHQLAPCVFSCVASFKPQPLTFSSLHPPEPHHLPTPPYPLPSTEPQIIADLASHIIWCILLHLVASVELPHRILKLSWTRSFDTAGTGPGACLPTSSPSPITLHLAHNVRGHDPVRCLSG